MPRHQPDRPAVMGLDLSLTRTGVALPSGETFSVVPTTGSEDRGKRLHEIWLGIATWLNMCAGGDRYGPTPELVAIERYNPGGVQGFTMAHLGELGGVVRCNLAARGIAWLEVPPATIKKLATGHGNANKEEMIAAARAAGATVANSDEADAYWLREWGHRHLGGTL